MANPSTLRCISALRGTPISFPRGWTAGQYKRSAYTTFKFIRPHTNLLLSIYITNKPPVYLNVYIYISYNDSSDGEEEGENTQVPAPTEGVQNLAIPESTILKVASSTGPLTASVVGDGVKDLATEEGSVLTTPHSEQEARCVSLF